MDLGKLLKNPLVLLLLVIRVQSFAIDEVIEEEGRGKKNHCTKYIFLIYRA